MTSEHRLDRYRILCSLGLGTTKEIRNENASHASHTRMLLRGGCRTPLRSDSCADGWNGDRFAVTVAAIHAEPAGYSECDSRRRDHRRQVQLAPDTRPEDHGRARSVRTSVAHRREPRDNADHLCAAEVWRSAGPGG